MKVCAGCRAELPLSEFHRKSSTRDGLNSRCKACALASSRASYQRVHGSKNAYDNKRYHRSGIADRTLRAKYGIGQEDYARMENAQGRKCAICGSHGDLHVDHCHAAGKVRGLLCGRCNQALGLFKDDPDRMYTAAHYVRMGAYR